MTLSEELAWRGFLHQTTYKDVTVLDKAPLSFYFGVDPSAASMQVGNLAAAMMVKLFLKHGHQAFLLVGGATGLIGDPDGKSQERSLKTQDEVNANKTAIAKQYQQLFKGQQFTLVDNYDWFSRMGYLEFLRDVGKHVPMRQMLQREFVQSRLGEGGAGISYAEFSYVLIQAYDFLQLYHDHDVTLQLCGSDQWGNSIAGVELIRRIEAAEANVWSIPLVINKATGKKFGKSEEGAIWLDPALTTPTRFYQFWINADDQGVEEYLKIFTELEPGEIEALIAAQQADPAGRAAQTALAQSVTALVHGSDSMRLAAAVTEYLVGKRSIAGISSGQLAALRQEIGSATTTPGGSVLQAAVDSRLATTLSEARRLLQGKALAINGTRIERPDFEPDDFQNGRLLLKKGKKARDTALVELA